MMKTLANIIIIMIITIILPSAHAADSTPSADIQVKLEDFKKEIASKAAALKQQVDKKLKDKAYVGKLKTKSEAALTLATKSGPRIVNINQDSEFESKVKLKQKFSLKTVAEEDYLVALGDVDETEVLTAKKVILLPQSKDQQKTYLWGQILSISDKLVTLKGRDQKNVAVSISRPSDIKLNDFVIMTGTTSKNDIFEAEFIHVIPQGVIIKPKKTASPSAQIASPSAKLKSATASAKPKSITR